MHWTVLRTMYPIERLNKEFKRHTRAMEVTGGAISNYRCLAYLSHALEYRWSFHTLWQLPTVYTLNVVLTGSLPEITLSLAINQSCLYKTS